MSYWNHQAPYTTDTPVFKSSKMHSTVSVKVDRTSISRNAAGRYAIPSGVFLASVAGVDRPLPCDYTTAAITTSNAYLPVTHTELFAVGDTIYHKESTNSITLGGTWVAADVITIQIGSRYLRFPVTQTTPTAVATELVTYINDSWLATDLNLRATSAAGVVSLFSSGDLGAFAVTENSTAGTVAAGAATFNLAYPLIGVVSAVNDTLGRLTLVANSAINVPIGAAVGTNVDHVHGLHPQSIDLDDARSSVILPAYSEGDVYRVGLVYWDNILKATFPEINVYSQT